MSMSIPGARPKVNTIGGSGEVRLKAEKKVWVSNPTTGERLKVTISNARDMVERRPQATAWHYASALPQVDPMPSIAAQKRADELEQAREVLRAAGELPPEEDQDNPLIPVLEQPTVTPGANGDPQPDAVAAAAVEDDAE
jgi:hypothetical protein